MAFAPVVTSFYAGILALMLVGLTAYVILARMKFQVSLGDGGNEEILRRSRMQGNFVEFVPTILVLMLIMELNGLHESILHIIGLITIVSRSLHAYALHNKSVPLIFRQAGMIGTLLVIIGAAIMCLSRIIF